MVVKYKEDGYCFLGFLMHMKGSVFPKAFAIAAPCSILAAFLKMLINHGYLDIWSHPDSILKETQAFAGFSFLVGFLIVFRTSQEYSRFWDGVTAVHHMQVEWFDAASALASFSSHSRMDKVLIRKFMNMLIRLFSMLHASALAEMEGDTGKNFENLDFELIDPGSIDTQSLKAFMASDSKTELIYTWIQFLLVDNISTGVLNIPPPILSRAFQEIAGGMVAFHDAVRITRVPFPFPYAQTCDLLLVLHWLVAPIVTTQWVTQPWWAAIFVYVQVFILWSLNLIAVEIENPFGKDTNDLDSRHMQMEMNRHLLLLLHPDTRRAPQLVGVGLEACIEGDELCEIQRFSDAWNEVKSKTTCATTTIGTISTLSNVKQEASVVSSQYSVRSTLADVVRGTVIAQNPPVKAKTKPIREATNDSSLPSSQSPRCGTLREATFDSQRSSSAQRGEPRESQGDSRWRRGLRQSRSPSPVSNQGGAQAVQASELDEHLHTRPQPPPERAPGSRGRPCGPPAVSEAGERNEAYASEISDLNARTPQGVRGGTGAQAELPPSPKPGGTVWTGSEDARVGDYNSEGYPRDDNGRDSSPEGLRIMFEHI